MIICKVTIASIVDKHINSVGNLMSYLFIKLKSTTTPATGQAAIIKTDILAKWVNGINQRIPETVKFFV